MRRRKNRQNKELLDQIEELKIDNQYLHNGIKMLEEVNDSVRNDKDTQIYIIKHLTYLILYMEALEFAAKDNRNPTSKIIVDAITHFKEELTDKFFDDGNDLPNKNRT